MKTTFDNEVLRTAVQLTEAGLSVIPIRPDGTKKPATNWKQFQSQIADSHALKRGFCSGSNGIAIVAGAVSGNLEVLDFDDSTCFKPWWELAVEILGGDESLMKLPMVRTPSGGFHLYYRCKDGVERNQKLALRKGPDGKHRVLIETRGEGGYVIAPGSPADCHELKLPYELLGDGDLTKIPTVRGEERELLLAAARALSEYVQPSRIISVPFGITSGGRPGDHFNGRADWMDILIPHGWEKVGGSEGTTYWRRPGKEEPGISATTNFGGGNLLYVFSTNAAPFESGRGYSKFAAYTFLEHSGDFKAAASDLAAKGYREKATGASPPSFASRSWPEPFAKEAFQGLAGEIVRAIAPHTEADDSALLLQFLTAFGNVVGASPHFAVEGDRHSLKLYVIIVGETSKARKGTSWGHVRSLFQFVDPSWVVDRIQSGLSSGEGLIWAVRDPIITGMEPKKKEGHAKGHKPKIPDPGVSDKRLLVVEGEFASTLKVLRREGNTLSSVIRSAWDTGDLNTLVKHNPAKATGAHISMIGHISKEELLRHLEDTEAANGFGNRYLWGCARRSKVLPEGGCIDMVHFRPLIDRLREAVRFARMVGEIKRDEEARKLWHEVYPELSEGKAGLFGAITARAEAQVMRLACIYAILDQSTLIRKEHLVAALAIWEYCEASCLYIFDESLGDPVADQLLKALQDEPDGMTRTAINNLFKRHQSSARLERALNMLVENGLILSRKQNTGGRPAEIWFATEHAKQAKEAN